MKPVHLGVVGATGLVGRTTLDILREWNIPLLSLRLFASSGSAGRCVDWNGQQIALEELAEVPDGLNAAIFCTGREISRQWVPRFRVRGIVTIDHSSEYRMEADVPLVIPEINGHTLAGHGNLIANPNCSASVALLPLAALDREIGLRRVIISTYQSVSGTGQDALAELEAELVSDLHAPRVYPRRIAHNVFPQVGDFEESGTCEEERKIEIEIQKILDHPDLPVMSTTVRVPVRVGHAISSAVELKRAATRTEIEHAFSSMPGMVYERQGYRTQLEIAGKQEIFVSRLRSSEDLGSWWQFWAVGDNLRKGAASNAIQILQVIFAS